MFGVFLPTPCFRSCPFLAPALLDDWWSLEQGTATGGGHMKLEKILVALDGSTLAEAAMWTALDLAEKNASISLLRAAEAYPRPGADAVEAQVIAIREAEEYLAAVVRRLADRAFQRVETHVWYGPAAAAIVEAAAAHKVDMIVMSSHGRTGLGRLILGSVAESVLRGTTVPILIVRADTAPVDVPRGAEPARKAPHV
jgi:nucleotide-binding universal stress UspA family protein